MPSHEILPLQRDDFSITGAPIGEIPAVATAPNSKGDRSGGPNSSIAREVAAPPSGVEGRTPTEVRACLVENGWPVLPILKHDHPTSRSGGKAPASPGWQRFAQFETPLPTTQDFEDWERMRSAPGTGIA